MLDYSILIGNIFNHTTVVGDVLDYTTLVGYILDLPAKDQCSAMLLWWEVYSNLVLM